MVKTYLLNDTCYFNGHELRDKSTGDITSLDPKIAQLLSYLIENPDVIISRDDLLEQVWANTVINENTINWAF